MYKVLVTDPISDKGLAIITDAGLELVYEPALSPDSLYEAVADVHGWVIRSGTTITAEHLDLAKNLQVIGRAGVGVDNIDIKAATNKGVLVMNMPDGNTISAAEHTMALISTLSRNIQLGHLGLVNGEWNRHALVGNELRGKTLGVVGLGRIGRELIKRAHGFEMKILGYDPYVNQEMFNPEKVKVVDIDELTAESDFISVHVPLTDNTRDLYDAKRLATMKPTARIINVARGGIINEADLANALNNDVIAGAALDVFVSEPLGEDHPLVAAKNILLTPHLGASTHEAKEGVSLGICEQVRDFLKEEKLSNPINMPISDMSKLKALTPLLELAEVLGKIQFQLCDDPVKSVSVECFGNIDDAKPVALSFIKGILSESADVRLNFVNAGAIAEDRGISFSHSYNTDTVSFSNLIVTHVTTQSGTIEVAGSVFGDNHSRLVDIKGYEVDVRPEGVMVLIQNKDVPGVIGRVGMVLGDAGVNIAEYLLSRTSDSDTAFAVVKIDEKLSDSVLSTLNNMDEILTIKQLAV
ncbi:MAG: phosphoglycerate dehydrogenase [Candidatus Marinimicrobia bacterium]|nr:phosphoglycerate dehydrogenase [Candidatus Neomarinimicrobiota bacterium]